MTLLYKCANVHLARYSPPVSIQIPMIPMSYFVAIRVCYPCVHWPTNRLASRKQAHCTSRCPLRTLVILLCHVDGSGVHSHFTGLSHVHLFHIYFFTWLVCPNSLFYCAIAIDSIKPLQWQQNWWKQNRKLHFSQLIRNVPNAHWLFCHSGRLCCSLPSVPPNPLNHWRLYLVQQDFCCLSLESRLPRVK